MTLLFSANSRESVATLAETLDNSNIKTRMEVLLYVTEKGYMVPSLPQRIIEWAIRLVKGAVGVERYRIILWGQHPDVFKAAWADFIHHMKNGRDTYDRDSVGGYSQREINDIAGFYSWRTGL